MNDLARKTIELAQSQVGVREHGRNRGPEVDGYWREIGMDAGGLSLQPAGIPKPWCAVFVSAMVKRAAEALGLAVPIHLTAGVYTLIERAPEWMRVRNPVPGAIFIKGYIKDGRQILEHTGFVEDVSSIGIISTIEGNTNPGGSSEGDGVYARTRRREELLWLLDLSAQPSISAAA